MAPRFPIRPERGAELLDCDSEPIHLSSGIQPLGALYRIEDGSRVRQVACAPGSALQGEGALGQRLGELYPSSAALFETLEQRLPLLGTLHLGVHREAAAAYDVIAHRSGTGFIVEFEQVEAGAPGSFDAVYPHIRGFLDRLQSAATIEEIADLVAVEVRRMTGLDRALVYRFDDLWNGEVIAEDRNDALPSYLGLHFPAHDIPAQARELYRRNRLRLIASADYTPAPVVPALDPETRQPLDLSYAVLRSVSPVHLEYMRNMGTQASMSISLLRGDRLWGLIACHNSTPTTVPYQIRNGCDFVGQVASMQIAAKEAGILAERRHRLRGVQRRLLSSMAAADHFIDGLVARPFELLALTGAAGAAVVADGACQLVGDTPSQDEVGQIVQWLAGQRKQDQFATEHLDGAMPGGAALKDTASGVLAISISQVHDSFLIWFRPEVLRTLSWGGEPVQIASQGTLQIHPRKSFETWQQIVRLRALPWHESEIDAAAELRTAIVDIVLRKAEEMAALSERLTTSNKELEAFSYSVSHDLRAPFRHIVGYAQLLKKFEGSRLSDKGNRYIDTIVESAVSAGTLVDNLLSFSQMGRAKLRFVAVDINELVQDLQKRFAGEGGGRSVQWIIADLPGTRGDPVMLRTVFQNLIENALKFSRDRDPPRIEIGFAAGEAGGAYYVRDNGVGFDMAYVGKLFGVFQRLHRVEEFEGTGIGLANVKRIVERHGGKAWADAEVDKGATVYFTLPPAGEH